MKSLEIVNELIYKCNDFLGDCITCVSKENLEQIQRALEALEILLIKSVDLEDLFYLFNKYPDEEDEYILECYNDCHKRKLTMEELQKIK